MLDRHGVVRQPSRRESFLCTLVTINRRISQVLRGIPSRCPIAKRSMRVAGGEKERFALLLADLLKEKDLQSKIKTICPSSGAAQSAAQPHPLLLPSTMRMPQADPKECGVRCD